MAKIVKLQEIAGPKALKILDESIPQPGVGEVLVKMMTAGLNRAEWLFMYGQYFVDPELPSRIGVEGAGVIEAIGADVTDYKTGQHVCITPNMTFEKFGIIGDYAVVPASALTEKPESLSWEEAAAIWMAYPTAYGALVFAGGLKEGTGQTVLISAASSSVGLPAIQIAKAHGATVIATSRTLEKEATLRAHGADHVVATNDENWPEKVMELTSGKGFDVAFDPITGPFTTQLAEAAATGATIVSYGVLSMADTLLPLFPMMQKGLKFTGFHVVLHLFQHADRLEQTKAHILPRLEDGTYKPKIDKVFNLEQVIEAYEYMDSGQQEGKIIVKTS